MGKDQPSQLPTPDVPPHHMKALEELKEILKDEIPSSFSDTRLLNFLRAKKFDVEQTTEMLREDFKWRNEEKVDEVFEQFAETEHGRLATEYWPNRIHGFDKYGVPVVYDKTGSCDTRSLLQVLNKDELLKTHIYFQERQQKSVDEAAAKMGKPLNCGIVFIADLEGLGWKHMYAPGLAVAKELFTMDQYHYPEILRKCIIINAPRIFTMFYNALKPFVDPSILERAEVYGSDYVEALKREIPEEYIPTEYGGMCKEHGIHCIGGGGTFIYGDPSRKPEEEETVCIKAGEQHVVEIETKDDTILYWQFQTISADVGFSVAKITPKGKRDVCGYFKYQPNKWHESHIMVPEGKYELVWDNSYSVLRSKTVKFKVEIMESGSPSDDLSQVSSPVAVFTC